MESNHWNSRQLGGASWNCDPLSLSKHTHAFSPIDTQACVCACTHTLPARPHRKRATYTPRIQPRGLIGRGGHVGGIPSSVPSTNRRAESDQQSCNRIPEAHHVPSAAGKQPASLPTHSSSACLFNLRIYWNSSAFFGAQMSFIGLSAWRGQSVISTTRAVIKP